MLAFTVQHAYKSLNLTGSSCGLLAAARFRDQVGNAKIPQCGA